MVNSEKLQRMIGIALRTAVIFLAGCAQTVTSYPQDNQTETKAHQQTKRLLVTQAPQDRATAHLYQFKVVEEVQVQNSSRPMSRITTQRYPFSLARKFDDILMGVLGAPFTPLAIIGGLASGESDLILFPLSALNPFANFRPDKAGLLTGPVSIEHQQYTEAGEWSRQPTKNVVQPLANATLKVTVWSREITVITDKEGIAIIDLNQVAGNDWRDSLSLSIRTANQMQCQHLITRDRLLASRPGQLRVPSLPLQPSTPRLPVMTRAKTGGIPINNAIKPGAALFYKLDNFGYWVNGKGLAVFALPAHSNVKIYADEYLRYQVARPMISGKSYYLFGFAFDPVTQITLAVKIGLAPLESKALGWVSAQEVLPWNTPYRLALKKPLELYATEESCQRNNRQTAIVYGPDAAGYVPALPVLDRTGKAWCLAYPDPDDPAHALRLGWIRQQEETVATLQIRVMKHKMDRALKFLENRVIWGMPLAYAHPELKVKLTGPLALVKMTGEMFIASFNKDNDLGQPMDGLFLDLPKNEQNYVLFQSSLLYFSNLMSKNGLWEGEDVAYVAVE